MEINLAYSPCPNDTFAFHAMINGLVDTEGLTFKVHLADVEELNQSAIRGEFEVTKLSYHGFFEVAERYVMLNSGSALGFNNGPLLVQKEGGDFNSGSLIAIPGMHTTAALLLKTAYPQCTNVKPMLFSDIEGAVLSGEVDAGVLIHEGRFTYRDKGLKLVQDLGEFWQESFGVPIPLGGIAVRRDICREVMLKVGRVLKRSVEYAFANPNASAAYVMENAQELTAEVQQKHINLFVNNFTVDLGEQGRRAVEFLYTKYAGGEKKSELELFI